jgi:hypothetical protein
VALALALVLATWKILSVVWPSGATSRSKSPAVAGAELARGRARVPRDASRTAGHHRPEDEGNRAAPQVHPSDGA